MEQKFKIGSLRHNPWSRGRGYGLFQKYYLFFILWKLHACILWILVPITSHYPLIPPSTENPLLLYKSPPTFIFFLTTLGCLGEHGRDIIYWNMNSLSVCSHIIEERDVLPPKSPSTVNNPSGRDENSQVLSLPWWNIERLNIVNLS